MASKTIPFRTAYSERERVHCGSGSMYQDEFGYEIDKFGRKVLKKTGETNLYAKIQASLEETKIENILKRVVAGDDSMLRPDGIYADLTELPSNLIEARQAMQNLENVWNDLDNDIKRKYNFNLDEFIGASGSDSWLRDMGLLNDTKPETKTEAKTEAKEESANE